MYNARPKHRYFPKRNMNNVNLLLVTVTPLQKQIHKENLVYMQTFKNKRTLYPYRAFFLLLIYGRLDFFQ